MLQEKKLISLHCILNTHTIYTIYNQFSRYFATFSGIYCSKLKNSIFCKLLFLARFSIIFQELYVAKITFKVVKSNFFNYNHEENEMKCTT